MSVCTFLVFLIQIQSRSDFELKLTLYVPRNEFIQKNNKLLSLLDVIFDAKRTRVRIYPSHNILYTDCNTGPNTTPVTTRNRVKPQLLIPLDVVTNVNNNTIKFIR